MAPLIWAILGLVFILSEFVVPEFVIFFFGLGALLNSVLTAIFPGIASSIPLQILTWLGLSAASLFSLRRYLSRWFQGRKFEEDDQADWIGRSAKVTQQIGPDNPGRISLNGTTWVAESYGETFEAGDTVEVIRREGTRFLVTKSLTGLPELDELSETDEADNDVNE
jgi:membrane protein implicated in regulation of membrane protease activity